MGIYNENWKLIITQKQKEIIFSKSLNLYKPQAIFEKAHPI